MDNPNRLPLEVLALVANKVVEILGNIYDEIDFIERKTLPPRDEFAKAALKGLLSRQPDIEIPVEAMARLAFEYADAMIAASKTKSP